MRKFFRNLRAYFLASLAFVISLVKRRDAVIEISEKGHSLLEGWNEIPEEKRLREFNQSRLVSPMSLGCLIGIDGVDEGALYPMTHVRETLGVASDNAIVLTPRGKIEDSRYVMVAVPEGSKEGGSCHFHLCTVQGSLVQVNQTTKNETEVFDYDEIQLLGNRYLFLNCSYLI